MSPQMDIINLHTESVMGSTNMSGGQSSLEHILCNTLYTMHYFLPTTQQVPSLGINYI